MSNRTTKLKRLVYNRIFQHFLFWALSFLILANVLKVSADIKKIDLVYTVIFHIPILIIVYCNLKVLFPIFLERGRYFYYALFVLVLTAVGAGFYVLLFDKWIDYVFKGYYFIAFYSFWDISLYFVIYLAATSLIRLARGYFRLQEIEKEKTLAELKALKSQINPHFLFNSLNSIYSLARKKSDNAPQKIVQLSDLMRHILYEADADFIPLSKEVEMIKNYIELQNLRTSEKEKIILRTEGDVNNKKIAPLLFLPFVENGFKHGMKGGTDHAFMNINIDATGKVTQLEIENSKGKPAINNHNSSRGIGIDNVRKRLELIYPGLHSLKISEKDHTFKVLLQVQL